MKKILLTISLALALVAAPVGCKTNEPPARTAYKATGSVLDTVQASMDSWRIYVTAEKAAIEKLRKTDPGAAIDRSTELLKREGRVSGAYYKFQEVTKAAIIGGTDVAAQQELSKQVAAAGAQVVNLITLFTSTQ